jgi:hypothetical protein
MITSTSITTRSSQAYNKGSDENFYHVFVIRVDKDYARTKAQV